MATVFQDAAKEWRDEVRQTEVAADKATETEKVTNDINDKLHDPDIILLLSNYFRKYVKHSDAVPHNLDTLIKGTPRKHTHTVEIAFKRGTFVFVVFVVVVVDCY